MKKIINQFNKSGLLWVIILAFTVSCSDSFLDENPKGFYTSDNVFSQPVYIEQGIVALHNQIRSNWHSYANDMPLQTDLAYNGENPGGGSMMNYPVNMTPTAGSTNYWNYPYAGIQKANVLIEAINNLDESMWINPGDKETLLAEAMFFRALNYRILVVFFGDVPLVTDVIDYVKTDFVRAPKAEIYRLMESDLEYGTTHLPVRGAEKAPGRITQGAAWHLLCETYLIQSKFQDAVNAASHVINDYGYALMTRRFGTKLGNDIFGSGDPYFDLFGYGNHNLPENTEGIYVIQYNPNELVYTTYMGERAYGPAYYRMGNTPDGFLAFRGEFFNGAYTGYSDTLSRPVAWNCPTNYVKYTIWEGGNWDVDQRNAEHNIKRNFYFDNPASAYHGQKIEWSLYAEAGVERANPMMDTIQYIFPFFMKVAAPLEHFSEPARSGGGYNHKCVYAFRLAETYLFRAEAYLGLNQLDRAAEDINEVRNRARAIPVTPEEVTIDYILDERVRELYAEEMRDYTLMRLGKLVERTRKYNNNPINPGLNIQDYHNLWPIPQSEIDRNINAVLTQNPGYPN